MGSTFITASNKGVSDNALLSVIGESSPDVITQVDAEGRIIYWTPGAERMLGYKEEEILGKDISMIVPPELHDRVRHGIQQQFEGRIDVVHEESVRLNKAGERIPVLLTRVPIRNNHCEIIALLAILKDQSEQKKLQKQVENLERNTAMAKVAAKVAHEIRTPLGVLFLKSDLLNERLACVFEDWGKGDVEAHRNKLEKLVADIQKQTSRLEEIANNYLHLSKTRTMERERVNIKRFMKDIRKELKEQYPEPEMLIEEQVDERVDMAELDSQQIHRVFVNLVRNSVEAIRATNAGQGVILLRVTPQHANLIFEIIDNGPGIPQEIMEAVFDPFTTTKSIGTGLGLYLAREIVVNHGGTIEIDTKVGKGTTIRFVLPTERGDD
ncbi:MAG: two-component system sensor histidine kinase NtrB [bacterium]|jgi:two-component system sporulation sensor kinase A